MSAAAAPPPPPPPRGNGGGGHNNDRRKGRKRYLSGVLIDEDSQDEACNSDIEAEFPCFPCHLSATDTCSACTGKKQPSRKLSSALAEAATAFNGMAKAFRTLQEENRTQAAAVEALRQLALQALANPARSATSSRYGGTKSDDERRHYPHSSRNHGRSHDSSRFSHRVSRSPHHPARRERSRSRSPRRHHSPRRRSYSYSDSSRSTSATRH